MGDRSAFFYGTLMAPQVLHRVCHGSPRPTPFQTSLLTIRPAVLHAYCRHRVRDCDYPAIVPAPGVSVRGMFVQGLTDGDFWRLDVFEGEQYRRERVRVRVLEEGGEREEREAETYVWADGSVDLEEGEWDFGEWRAERMGRWICGGEEYGEVDEAVREAGKDPTGGRGANGRIGEQLAVKDPDGALESAVRSEPSPGCIMVAV